MEYGNETVNKPKNSRESVIKESENFLKSIDKNIPTNSPEELIKKDKEILCKHINKIIDDHMLSIVAQKIAIENKLNELGYGEIYNYVINNLNRNGGIELSFFDNIKPSFSYYYNNRTARRIIKSKGITGEEKIDGYLNQFQQSENRKEKPLPRDEIEERLNEFENEFEAFNKRKKEFLIIKNQIDYEFDDIMHNTSDESLDSAIENFSSDLDSIVNNILGVKCDYVSYVEFIKIFIGDENESEIDNTLDLFGIKKEFFDDFKKYYVKISNALKYIIRWVLFNRDSTNLCISRDEFKKLVKETRASNQEIRDGMESVILSTESSTEPSTESSTKPSTESSTEPSTESSTKPSTESSTEPSTESSTKPSTGSSAEKTIKSKNKNPKITVELVEKAIYKKINFEIMLHNFEDIFEKIKNIYKTPESLKEPLETLKSFMNESLKTYKKSQLYIYRLITSKKQPNDADYLLYALSIGDIDIDSLEDLEEFKLTVKGDKETKYTARYNEFKAEMEKKEDKITMEYITQSLTARYEAAATVAEGRNFYESDFINFAISTSEGQTQTGLQVASNIDNIDSKLNHYGFKANRSEHEEAALKYTAFDITFKNTFNLTNPIIEKLAAQQVDLRDDLFKYGIYISENNYFNKEARDRYISEKLQPLGLAPEEIDELGNAIAGLPLEVENNYKILSGNFDADQNNFEKITKIFALGEIIDNIKNLFKNGEVFSDNAKLGTVMGFELDESEPADIVGDCLMLKGKINGTETKIKYDLRTGKLYMNALTQQEFNPPKITIGNDEPNTEIGDLGNFDDLLEGYQPTSFTQTDNVDYSKSSNENATIDENGDIINSDSSNKEGNETENKDSNQKTLEKLMENKLLEKLAIIGNTVREKAGEQSKENNVIDEFLRTFNILPDEGNSDTIEFLGGSNLYIILESIKNTNDEDYLLKFSKLMSELMSFCGLTRGKNNLSPKEPDFDSVTIFNIDEKNATQDIISLQKANQSFFSDTDGENDRIKGCECHFDSSVKLSFANIIVQKCCRRYGEGWKISANHAQEFVDSVKKGIEDIKHDENDVVAMENMIEDESMWA